jgi:hypothetical protein
MREIFDFHPKIFAEMYVLARLTGVELQHPYPFDDHEA